MNEHKTVVNVEEAIGKTVGLRRPPSDPLVIGMALQDTVNQILKTAGHKLARKGVFRFHSHEEADAWTQKMTFPNKAT